MRPELLLAKIAWRVIGFEIKRGTLLKTIKKSFKVKTLFLAEGFFLCDLLEDAVQREPEKIFLYFYDEQFSYRQTDEKANRIGNKLLELGFGPGQGLAIMDFNSPRFLDFFFGAEKIGMFVVPVNVSLRGDQLKHIFTNSNCDVIMIHHSLYEHLAKIKEQAPNLKMVIVNDYDEPVSLPEKAISIRGFYDSKVSNERPKVKPRVGDLAVLMYTSGTTGLPKGVVYRQGDMLALLMRGMGLSIAKPNEIYYTCLPLFHANALFVTTLSVLGGAGSLAMGKRFSASRFWDEVRRYNATTFNLLGAMIPILLKQPEKPNDKEHKIRRIITSSCPSELWEKFEQRFGVEIWEAYGAVDGGGGIIMNTGNAPKGSIGKPLGIKVKVVKDDGEEAKPREPGELCIYLGGKASGRRVEYYRDEKATEKKVRDGWLHTGDYVYRDAQGFFYFVGRDTEKVRKKGEMVSTYEVEQEILKHPAVQECAVYAVPAELGEDEIMVSLILVEGKKLEPLELIEFLKGRLAYFAIPRYVRVVDELPKTETHRVVKKKLQELGVTPDTWDAEKAGVRLKP